MVYKKQYLPDDIKDGRCPKCGNNCLLYSRGSVTCKNCGTTIGKTFNKYGAKKQEYRGQIYDSKFEVSVAEDLDTKLALGELAEVKRQVRIPLEAYGVHICNYVIDFIATKKDGTNQYIEAKGYETDAWKLKWKMLEAKLAIEDPSAELMIIKQGRRVR